MMTLVREKKSRIISLFIAALSLCVSYVLVFDKNKTQAAQNSVRLSVTAGSGDGIEQQLADNIADKLKDSPEITISTLNPDWYVSCKINHAEDRFTGQIRSNGTVTVKAEDGQIISTISNQAYNQDFSNQLGVPNNRQGAPLNKQLVQSASNEVVSSLAEKSVVQIKNAVQIELQSREYISEAESLANSDKYDEAIDKLKQVVPDSVHFKATRLVIDKYQMEKHSLELVNAAKAKAKSGQYSSAISLLKEVDHNSKRHKLAIDLINNYRHLLAVLQAKRQHATVSHTTTKSDQSITTMTKKSAEKSQ